MESRPVAADVCEASTYASMSFSGTTLAPCSRRYGVTPEHTWNVAESLVRQAAAPTTAFAAKHSPAAGSADARSVTKACVRRTLCCVESTRRRRCLPRLLVFGELKLKNITVQETERWRAGMSSVRVERELLNKTKNNPLVLMHAIFRHAVKLYGLPASLECHSSRGGWPTAWMNRARESR